MKNCLTSGRIEQNKHWRREFSDTNFEIGKLCQRFDLMLQSSSGQKSEAFNRNISKISNLKVGVRELSFAFMQEPPEKQPL